MAYTIRLKLTHQQLTSFIQSEFYTPELGNELLMKVVDKDDIEACKILSSVMDFNTFRYQTRNLKYSCPLPHILINTDRKMSGQRRELLEFCFNHGLNPNLLDSEQSTALPDDMEIFKLLLDYGLVPIYQGQEMISYKTRLNPSPSKWRAYVKAINDHNASMVKCAID